MLTRYFQDNGNPFVALCRHDSEQWYFSTCDLFKRSLTNKGLGFTFNNDKSNHLYKATSVMDTLQQVFHFNHDNPPKLMKTSDLEKGLEVLIENNMEENEYYDKSTWSKNPLGNLNLKPTVATVTLHNPKEPANIRSKSFNVPLGFSTTVYFTPTVREIDKSGKLLSESQRKCRLNEQTQQMKFFNEYSKEACLLECKVQLSYERCGCYPWDYFYSEV